MGFRLAEKFVYRVFLSYKMEGRRDQYNFNTGVVVNGPRLELAIEKAKKILELKARGALNVEPISVERVQNDRFY